MDPLTFEAASRNPELVRALMVQAHRERAEAVHRLIIEPIRSLFTRQVTASAERWGRWSTGRWSTP